MGDCKEYLRKKALLDWYNSLSDADKGAFAQSFTINNGDKIVQKLDEIESKVDKNHHSFGRGVLENVVGNYIADASIFILSKLFRLK